MRCIPIRLTLALLIPIGVARADDAPTLRAGAAAVDASPAKLPVIVNGGFLEAKADKVNDPPHARAIVLDDGTTRLALVVVDSCMMPRDLLDRAKELAREATGIPVDRMLISATHTHSAPSAMGALGSDPDPDYVAMLPVRIAEAIDRASKNLAPAVVGWAVVEDADHTHCRRWIYRPDRIGLDPFGVRSVRANMHPGHLNPDVIGPSGPSDPGLSVLALRSPEGRPIALLANYSMHYFGAAPVSADYYGRFARRVAELLDAQGGDPPFVAIMSQGTSGDQQWMDYGKARNDPGIDAFADALAQRAVAAYRSIAFRDPAPLAMAESELVLGRRTPDAERLAWAQKTVEAMGDRKPKTLPEVYAREAVFLHEEPTRRLKLQAIRIGDLGIAAIPDEVYALTGLKIKGRSPLAPTFTIELANGSEGYIPTPEQHALGGYTTWPARTAGLEVHAEPKIVEAVLSLLEKVSGRSRRSVEEPRGPYVRAVLDDKPLAYWRLDEMGGPEAADASGRGHPAQLEDGIAPYLEGPSADGFHGGRGPNRAAHFAGGRLASRIEGLGPRYTVELWFWNGLPNDARPVTGYLASRGLDGARGAPGDHLGLGGTALAEGRLFFFNGNALNQALVGRTTIEPKTWHHVALVRDGADVAIVLDGVPEARGVAAIGHPAGVEQIFIGGRNDQFAPFEGKIDEVALYDRALTADELAAHVRASELADRRAR